LSVWESSVSG